MAKKVLLVAYYWPPSNSAGAHRPLRFARHLPQFGWQPAVLTAGPGQCERCDPATLERVPHSIEVLRAPHPDLWRSFQAWRAKRLRRARTQAATQPGLPTTDGGSPSGLRPLARRMVAWAEARLYYPDRYMNWVGPAVQAARRRFAPGDLDAIFATGGPWSDFEVGYRLARAWHIPLVLDFRDGWTITPDNLALSQPGWAKRREHRRLAKLFDFAQAIVLLHGGYGEAYLAAYPGLAPDKIHLISSGFEPADLNCQPIPPRGQYLHLAYAGSLHGRQYDTLLLALRQLDGRARSPQLKLTVIGEGWQTAASRAARLGLTETVTCLPPQPRAATAARLAAAHALLLLGEYPKTGYELYLASKTFDYLALRRPILAVVPPNEAGRLVQRLGAGIVADVASLEKVEAAVLELIAAWETGTLSRFVPPESALAPFTEPGLTEALTRALEGAPPRKPYRPGQAALPPTLRTEGTPDLAGR